MLIPDMTPGTRRALSRAHAWAEALGSAGVQAEHGLLGLINEEDGRPAQLLLQQGVNTDQILKAFSVALQPLSMSDDLPEILDSYLQRLLYDARIHALELTGSPTVATDHLLLALLEESETLRGILQRLGFETDRLRDHLFAELGPPIELDEPLQLIDSHESRVLARILDANANRAREALRILEEAARFHLNDHLLTKLAKEVRHDLTQALLHHLPPTALVRARQTEHDVGTSITTSSESYRPSLRAVIQINGQRLQEALRSLEEYGKVQSPDFGRIVEKLRYRSYTLEQALSLGQDARDRLAHARLYLLVSKASCAASIAWTIREALAGGVSIVQLREKHKTDRELVEIAQEVRAVTSEVGAIFIINDRPDLARLTRADGVHLGQDDLSVHAARTILGPEALIGVSTHNPAQMERAILDGADYLGVGPTFPTSTKSFDTLAGLEYVKHVAASTTLPAFAIGGIQPDNVAKVVSAGLRRVAVSHAIAQAEEPQDVAKKLIALLSA